MPILYLETNFLVSHATGRDARTGEILSRATGRFRIVFPSVCIMEAFSGFEAERRRHNRLVGDFKNQVAQSRRNVVSPDASRLADHLGQAIRELRNIFNDHQGRLFAAIDHLGAAAELIHPTPEVLDESLARPLIGDTTDNVILMCLLYHAKTEPLVKKAFLSENWKDFELKPYPKAAIKRANIKYFSSPAKFLEWESARPEL